MLCEIFHRKLFRIFKTHHSVTGGIIARCGFRLYIINTVKRPGHFWYTFFAHGLGTRLLSPENGYRQLFACFTFRNGAPYSYTIISTPQALTLSTTSSVEAWNQTRSRVRHGLLVARRRKLLAHDAVHAEHLSSVGCVVCCGDIGRATRLDSSTENKQWCMRSLNLSKSAHA